MLANHLQTNKSFITKLCGSQILAALQITECIRQACYVESTYQSRVEGVGSPRADWPAVDWRPSLRAPTRTAARRR